MRTLRLGLIGGNITQTRSPALQIVCGLSAGINVTYDLLLPNEQALSFRDVFDRCAATGFAGVNVTYPYKEEVLKYASSGSATVAALGASNTVLFSKSPSAWNTDHTGFVAAYREKFGEDNPGRVLMLGAGGVGKAIAFALADLGAREVLLYDVDAAKALGLAKSMKTLRTVVLSAQELLEVSNIDGIVNCTPLGMDGRPGSALPSGLKLKPSWAFDAVYTPEDTLFKSQCENLGAVFLPGYDLYFHQGVQAFQIFSGVEVSDLDWIRKTLRR